MTTSIHSIENTTSQHAGKLLELSAGEVHHIAIAQIKPSPENDLLYNPYDPKNPDNRKLVADIRENGIKDPLVLSRDYYILSGHRRYYSARLAGKTRLPCLFEDITRGNVKRASDEYIAEIRSHNLQRVKTIAEQMRESIVDTDKETAFRSLISAREAKKRELDGSGFIAIEGRSKRSKISGDKAEMVNAILRVVRDRHAFWPLSVRTIHYGLLNFPPLRNCGKCQKRRVLYANNQLSYDDLCNLTARLRLENTLDWSAISDVTRPIDIARMDDSPSHFISREVDWFLTEYRRNLLQSQPHHIEIVGEKNTVRPTLQAVANEYGIPLTTARGFSSLDPRRDMMQRYRRSGKDRLIVLALTDLDPSGEQICHSFCSSLRDDFGVKKVDLLKVALNKEQVQRFNLPENMLAKEGDSKTKKFTAKHGEYVWELEALPLEVLQSELRKAIDSVLDVPAFNRELELQMENAVEIDRIRQVVLATVQQSGVLQ